MAGWGDVRLVQRTMAYINPRPENHVLCIARVIKKSCRITCFASKQLQQFEQRVLQTGSSEGGLQWQREGQQPRSTRYKVHGARSLESTVAHGFVKHSTRYKVHGARGLESTVAHGFVKHGFKVLLHRVVDGPLQASRCLVSRTPCVYTRYTSVFRPLAANDVQLVTHPPYSPDFAPCGWFLFPSVKRQLKGKQFQNAEDARAFFVGHTPVNVVRCHRQLV